MSYLVEYAPESFADLKKLTPTMLNRIIKKVDWLADNFDEIAHQSLAANLSSFYKLRVGDYRVIYEFDLEERVIFIARIGHRREVYD
jgi:mRNA interferase RelE/StbE